ncbi:MAG: C25 family cysteine peptidase, partial [Alphaproteobacteria bacterium]
SKQLKYSAPLARGRMLIISHDAFAPALAPFRAWKARRGIATELVLMSETDGTAAGLRDLVAQKYLEASGLTWIVLVGDRNQVPTNVGTYDASDADSRYAMILGDDLYPELFVSRISASTIQHVQTQVAKFIAYERDPDTGSAARWYSRAAGVASDEGVPADYERADLLRSDLLNQDFTTVERIYQGMGASTGTIAAAINEGCSLVNYLGHGSGLSWDSVVFRNADVAALTNDGRLPWIIDVSCYNGDFARDACFAETWLRAGTATAPAGAVGMIAASSLAPWTPPTVMQAEIIDLLTAGTRNTLGVLYYSGLMQVLDVYAGIPVATQVMEQNIVFGDASLMVRTKAPASYNVILPSSLSPTSVALAVEVAGPAGGTVAVTHAGQLLGVAEFSGPGQVSVPLNEKITDLSAVDVTITGFNMVPWQGIVGIASGTTLFELPAAQDVQLTVYDVRGGAVRQLVGGQLGAGLHEVVWQGRDDQGRAAPSGIYLYRLVTAEGSQGGRMVLSK